MNTFTKVDHKELVAKALELDSCVESIKKEMASADLLINSIPAETWSADDCQQLRSQWEHMSDRNSTYNNTINALTSYADTLRFAAQKYKEAQTNAINRASKLPNNN